MRVSWGWPLAAATKAHLLCCNEFTVIRQFSHRPNSHDVLDAKTKAAFSAIERATGERSFVWLTQECLASPRLASPRLVSPCRSLTSPHLAYDVAPRQEFQQLSHHILKDDGGQPSTGFFGLAMAVAVARLIGANVSAFGYGACRSW